MMTIGGVLLLVGAMVMITGWEYAPYIYLLGSVMFASAQLSDRYDGDDMILKRLRLQQVLGSILLVITGFLMFSGNYHQQLMFNNSMNDMSSLTLNVNDFNYCVRYFIFGVIVYIL